MEYIVHSLAIEGLIRCLCCLLQTFIWPAQVHWQHYYVFSDGRQTSLDCLHSAMHVQVVGQEPSVWLLGYGGPGLLAGCLFEGLLAHFQAVCSA